ncbi:MAG: hypothetical protein IKB65_07240 [Ruminiclostridium sp.]|nr:hypothetical protein [Ruminiclostridium sp.]
MRKSHTLIGAYIIFLFISPVICFFRDSDVLETIAFAATVAGYFFAVADCIQTTTSATKQRTIMNIDTVETLLEECEKVQERVDGESALSEIEGELEDIRLHLVEKKQEMKKFLKGLEDRSVLIDSIMMSGFLFFFFISFFDTAFWHMHKHINIVTTYAFAVVVANYYIREKLLERNEKEQTHLEKVYSAISQKIKECEQGLMG